MSVQLVFLGAPGSGKGTQAAKLVEKKGVSHVSTGDILRAEIAKGSDLGKKVQSIINNGDLVDDQTMLDLLKANCDVSSGTYIFDGFPRTLDQAKALGDQLLKGQETKAVLFEVDPDRIVARLTNRRMCKGCNAIYNMLTAKPKTDGVCDSCGEAKIYQRDDDKEDVIRNRLSVYNDAIGPVVDFYDELKVLKRVDASREPDEIFGEIEGLV